MTSRTIATIETPTLYPEINNYGLRSLALAVFTQAVEDAKARDPLTRADAITWLAVYGQEWLDSWEMGVKPSEYAKVMNGIKAQHKERMGREFGSDGFQPYRRLLTRLVSREAHQLKREELNHGHKRV